MTPRVGIRPGALSRRADRRLSEQPLQRTVPIARRRPACREETRRTSRPTSHRPPTTRRHRGGRDRRPHGSWRRQRWRTCSCSAASSRRTGGRGETAPGCPHSRWDQLAWRRTPRLRLRRVRGAPRRESVVPDVKGAELGEKFLGLLAICQAGNGDPDGLAPVLRRGLLVRRHRLNGRSNWLRPQISSSSR